MIFEQFKDKVCEALTEVMGDSYTITYHEMMKNNGLNLKGIIIDKKGEKIAPTIYLDMFFEDYKKGRAFGDILYDIMRIYRKSMKDIQVNMEFFADYEKVKGRILYKLVHRQSNQKLLEEIPYITWNDLAIIFYYSVEEHLLGKAVVPIYNSHLTMWNISLHTLYQDAKNNMPKLLPEEIISAKELIKEVFGEKLPYEMMKEVEKESRMYVLTNQDRMFGAASVLYTQILEQLSEKLQKDLIILPSSVHEVILVPDDGKERRGFYMDMVKEVNDTQVEQEEILSYSVYRYNRFTKKISIW